MAGTQVAAGGGGNGQQQQQNQGGGWRAMIFRALLFYMVISMFKGGNQTQRAVDPTTGQAIPPLSNLWKAGQQFDLRVYITESPVFSDFADTTHLVWREKNLYFDWSASNEREKAMNVTIPESVQRNGSIFAHIVFTEAGHAAGTPGHSIVRAHPLNKYMPKKKEDMRKSLLAGDEGKPGEEKAVEKAPEPEVAVPGGERPVLSYWAPRLVLTLICDYSAFGKGQLPAPLAPHFHLHENGVNYYPVFWVNDFWTLREHLVAINETTPELPLEMSFYMLAMWKWQMYLQMDQSWKMQQDWGSLAEGETDEMKRMFLEANPYLLALTFVVSMFHMVFDFMAFSSDIRFWKDNRSMEGLSVRSIFLNAFCQLIIFLYLMDNETSWMVLLSSGVGVIIEAWKITKACVVKLEWRGAIPRLSFTDRDTYKSKTKEFDDVAMKYLSWVMYPLIVGYSVYSLVFETHKSWYSWVLGSLTGCVYTFGFIMMTPQLWINYKLKSVAHLPWKTFTFKALNTFIDDLFAFIIKMPLMHRLACFRDDVVFLVYLYQRWIYPVDKSRVNEFGQVGDEAAAEAAGLVPVAREGKEALAAGADKKSDGEAAEAAPARKGPAKPDEAAPREGAAAASGNVRKRAAKAAAASTAPAGGPE